MKNKITISNNISMLHKKVTNLGKEVGKGTGLGLSISYGIVRDFGGDIDFESTYGNGTTFRIRFPRAPKGTDNG